MKSDLGGDDGGSIDLLSGLTVFLCSCCCAAALLMGTEDGQEADAASGVSELTLLSCTCFDKVRVFKFSLRNKT